MAEKNNAFCSICGTPYHICNSCLEQKTFKPWRTVTDTVEHYKIFLAIHGYSISKNKEEAKRELDSCNLSELKTFKPEIKAVIKEIMAEPKREKNISPKEKINDKNDILAIEEEKDED